MPDKPSYKDLESRRKEAAGTGNLATNPLDVEPPLLTVSSLRVEEAIGSVLSDPARLPIRVWDVPDRVLEALRLNAWGADLDFVRQQVTHELAGVVDRVGLVMKDGIIDYSGSAAEVVAEPPDIKSVAATRDRALQLIEALDAIPEGSRTPDYSGKKFLMIRIVERASANILKDLETAERDLKSVQDYLKSKEVDANETTTTE